MINSMDLVDVWRDKNPGVRRYTWRGPNKKQSLLDYFLVSSDIEYVVQSSDIGLSYRSDHSPVSIVLQFLNQTQRQGDMQIQ
jgi:exonuclease III